jgi:NAD(P)-dependent dehydrogenase (short-subunit alcohol dehydrogenase family)
MSEPAFQRVDDLHGFERAANVLVIGVSGGIGRAFVEALLPMPSVAKVVAASRSDVAFAHDKLHAESVDVTDIASCQRLAKRLEERLDQLDLVIFAAGLLHDEQVGIRPERQIKQVEPEAIERVFQVNTFALAYLARTLADLLPKRGRGVWANLSARVGSIGDNRLGGWTSYRAAKAAQNMITRNLAIEWGRRNREMTVLALHPGTTDTALSKPFQANVPEHKLFSPERVAHQLLGVINAHDGKDSGGFYDWADTKVEW